MSYRSSRSLPATATVLTALLLSVPFPTVAQEAFTTHSLLGAEVVTEPGRAPVPATVVIRDGIITSLGSPDVVTIPKGARVWNVSGLTIYPGFVEPFLERAWPEAGDDSPPQGGHANPRVRPERSIAPYAFEEQTAADLREAGFTAALVVPKGGVFRGQGAVIELGRGEILEPRGPQVVAFQTTRGEYPSSAMGAAAVVRQTFLDAAWYREARALWEKNPAQARPRYNAALEALAANPPVLWITDDNPATFQARRLIHEFRLTAALVGHGKEYQWARELTPEVPLILPLNFPKAPKVGTDGEAPGVTLADLRHWDQAPDNPRTILHAGVPVAFTTRGLKNPTDLFPAVVRALDRGLEPAAALAAVTTEPARLLGLSEHLGTVAVGRVANLLLVEGELWEDRPTIREIWVDGRRFPVSEAEPARPALQPEAVTGVWQLAIGAGEPVVLLLKQEGGELRGTLVAGGLDVPLIAVALDERRLTLEYDGAAVGHTGSVVLRLEADGDRLRGEGEGPDGVFPVTGERIAAAPPHPLGPSLPRGEGAVGNPYPNLASPVGVAGGNRGGKMASRRGPGVEVRGVHTTPQGPDFEDRPREPPTPARHPISTPLGTEPTPEQPEVLVVRGATVWTVAPGADAPLEAADLLVRRGIIEAVGRGLQVPDDAVMVDGSGLHLTPGIIDAHSHMAISGSANEGSDIVTAEVRIVDALDPDDIALYRALAGGATTAHVMHGSANAIGGQGVVIKLRWGAPPRDLLLDNAPAGIKFALGENPKRSGGRGPGERYPATRLGVEEILRRTFWEARQYRLKQAEPRAAGTVPPRRDLRLETLARVLDGDIAIHAHAYRADEILMLLSLGEELGFRVSVLHHALEGYKVADEIAAHGAAVATFSDWWGYKFEVVDGIPWNGALLYERGVLVSFKSDSAELVRRLNTEAAKAIRYGGLGEMEALALVTANPARQLGIENRVGTLEPGKDADFVLWSDHPLSAYSVPVGVWIDGRRYFDRSAAAADEVRWAAERDALIAKIRAEKGRKP